MRRVIPPLLLLAAACGEGSPFEPPAFEPELASTFTIAAGPEMIYTEAVDEEDRTSPHLTGDETLSGERYLVPDYLCLRADGTDWNQLPEGAAMPGEATYFEVLYPPEGQENGALVLLHHGNGLEFIEALALEMWKEFPDTAEDNNVHPETGTQDVEQSTRFGAKRKLVSEATSRRAVDLALAGATVVMPGNCWADGGHGMGERTSGGYYEGRRLGGLFDDATWAWAQENLEHNPDKTVGFGCSGGGHRISEQLARDGATFRAVVLDSPADTLSGFLVEPRPDLLQQVILFLRPVRFDEIMDSFFVGTWGGQEEADAVSLAVNLDQVPAEVPIYLSYSANDKKVTPPIVEPLAEALSSRESATVTLLDIEKHCQIDTDDGMANLLTWLEDNIGFSGQ